MNTETIGSGYPNCFKQLTAVLLPEKEGGFSVYCKELAGVNTMGDDEDHAMKMIKEATEFILEDYPLPIPWRKYRPINDEISRDYNWYEKSYLVRVPPEVFGS